MRKNAFPLLLALHLWCSLYGLEKLSAEAFEAQIVLGQDSNYYLSCPTQRGYLYTVQESVNLSDWSMVPGGYYYGTGNNLNSFMIEGPPPVLPTGSGTYPLRIPSSQKPHKLLFISLYINKDTGDLALARWQDPAATTQTESLISAYYPVSHSSMVGVRQEDADVVWELEIMATPMHPANANTFTPDPARNPTTPDQLRIQQILNDSYSQIVAALARPLPPATPPPDPATLRRYYRVVREMVDTNGNGLSDWFECEFFDFQSAFAEQGSGSSFYVDGQGDNDNDGLSNHQEMILGTNPVNPDSDGDGVFDSVDYEPTDGSIFPARLRYINKSALYFNFSHNAGQKNYFMPWRDPWNAESGAIAFTALGETLDADSNWPDFADAADKYWCQIGDLSALQADGYTAVNHPCYPQSYDGPQSYGNAEAYRLWAERSNDTGEEESIQVAFLAMTWARNDFWDEDSFEGLSIVEKKLTIPATETVSEPQSLITDLTIDAPAGEEFWAESLRLQPIQLVPVVLRCNADFDEGDLGPLTLTYTYGSVRPDSSNDSLKSMTQGVDRLYNEGDLVTKDLHLGWFGPSPESINAELMPGDIITIRSTTPPGITYPLQQGEVRFWATWFDAQQSQWKERPINVSALGLPHQNQSMDLNLVGVVYGPNPEIPSYAKLWVEGCKPGKVQLTLSITMSGHAVTFNQVFDVATIQSKKAWQEVSRQRIWFDSQAMDFGALQSLWQEVDMNTARADIDFGEDNHYTVEAVYSNYGASFFDNTKVFLWAGLAKRAGATIYGGLSDAQDGTDFGVAVAKQIQTVLMQGMLDVYNDISWQFNAYQIGGIKAIEHFEDSTAKEIAADVIEGWRLIENGRLQNNSTSISSGNLILIRQEQEKTLRKSFADLGKITVEIPYQVTPPLFIKVPVSLFMSTRAESPIPNGFSLHTVVPGANLCDFDQRWIWITHPEKGMAHDWDSRGDAGRREIVNEEIHAAADHYMLRPPSLR